jgi:V/A-type H+/Na+-transporting ATPase subunit E
MKTLDKGPDKIKKISEELRKETLEPAKQEAAAIIEDAKKRAEKIVLEGEKHAEKMIMEARKEIEQERNVFQSSLTQAGKLSLESLKQAIEEKFFNQELNNFILQEMTDTKVIANLINAIVKAIEKEGISTDISALIPQNLSAKEVNALLLSDVQKKLREQGVNLGDFKGGVEVKLHDKNLTIDITAEALEDLLSHYLRKDFRKLLFNSKA